MLAWPTATIDYEHLDKAESDSQAERDPTRPGRGSGRGAGGRASRYVTATTT